MYLCQILLSLFYLHNDVVNGVNGACLLFPFPFLPWWLMPVIKDITRISMDAIYVKWVNYDESEMLKKRERKRGDLTHFEIWKTTVCVFFLLSSIVGHLTKIGVADRKYLDIWLSYYNYSKLNVGTAEWSSLRTNPAP